MGCCLSSEDHEDERLNQKTSSKNDRPVGVGMGVAMMMQQAGVLVGASTIDVTALQAQIRKAKAEGRTVTLVNGSLYFDYHLVARIPPMLNLRV